MLTALTRRAGVLLVGVALGWGVLAPVQAVLPPVLNATPPAVAGTPQVGSTLSASPGSWNPSDVTIAYQWLSQGVAVSGATAATYVPGPSDTGRTIAVQVTASKPGLDDGVATSAPTAPVVAATTLPTLPMPIVSTRPPVVKGTAEVGHRLRVTTGSWSPAPDSLSYRWLADGKPIRGRKAKALVLRAPQLGARITVEVTARLTGAFVPSSVTTSPTAKVRPDPRR